MQPGGKGTKQIAANKKAYHDYFVLDRFEAGLELTGTEVKSIRAGTLNLKDSYCRVVDGELWLIGMHISPYKLELGLCKGKKLYDKRADAADKSARREIDRKMKEVNS